jgi:hypothetical protein
LSLASLSLREFSWCAGIQYTQLRDRSSHGIENVCDLNTIDAIHHYAMLETGIAYMHFKLKVGVDGIRMSLAL